MGCSTEVVWSPIVVILLFSREHDDEGMPANVSLGATTVCIVAPLKSCQRKLPE
jgi:hypothetical protein